MNDSPIWSSTPKLARVFLLIALSSDASSATEIDPGPAKSEQASHFAALHGELTGILDAAGVVGGAWVFVSLDEGTHAGYFGVTESGTQRAVDASTRFRVGSISKNLTALLTMRLVETGVVALDAPISAYTDRAILMNPWGPRDPVSMAQLLEHTSGLAGSSYRDYATNIDNASSNEFLKHTGELKPRWKPGTFYSYSNTGYGLAGVVLEDAAGMAFDELMRQELIEPLGLETASFLTEGDDPALVATGHDRSGKPQPTWAMPFRPAGSLVVSPADLARVVQLYLRRGALEDELTYVRGKYIERMERGETSLAAISGVRGGSYGLGQFGFVVGDRVYRGHWGKTEGFLATFGYLPEHGVGFVLAINTDAPRAMSECREAINRFFSEELPRASGPATSPTRLDPSLCGHYVCATHDMPMRDWVFKMLDQKHIEIVGDAYRVSSVSPYGKTVVDYRSAIDGGFLGENLPIVDAAAVTYEGASYWVSGESYRKVTTAEAFVRRWGVAATLLSSVLVILWHLLQWIALRVRGKRNATLGRLRCCTVFSSLMASLAVLTTVGLFVRFGLLGSSTDLTLLGTVSVVSAAIAATSLATGAAGFAFLVCAMAELRRSRGWRTAASVLLSLLYAHTALLWLASGWVPLITWH